MQESNTSANTSTSQKGKAKPKKGKPGPIHKQVTWSLKQRKRLLSLLQEYPIDAYKSIANRMQDKDEEQVKEYILKIKESIKNSHKKKPLTKEEIQRAPLEEWLEIASEMVEFENVDSSANLAKVMSIISNFEDFQTVKLEKYDGPDFKSIYKYMTQILQINREEDLIKLGPLESAIMLDMLHSLMEVISEHDLTVQRNVMKWKYQLMEARDKIGHSVPEYMYKASENDFTDFINEAKMVREQSIQHEKRYMENRAKKQAAARKDVEKKTASVASSADTESVCSTSSEALNTQTEEVIEVMDGSDKPSFKRHKPGRKGALDPPEIPRTEIYLVMPPKGVEIVNYNPRAKKVVKERQDGKYQALNQAEELINNDLSREITYDVHRTELDQFTGKQKQKRLSVEERKQRQEQEDELDAKYASVIKSDEERARSVPLKKPKLYSLNPFCLPVTLLDIESTKKKGS